MSTCRQLAAHAPGSRYPSLLAAHITMTTSYACTADNVSAGICASAGICVTAKICASAGICSSQGPPVAEDLSGRESGCSVVLAGWRRLTLQAASWSRKAVHVGCSSCSCCHGRGKGRSLAARRKTATSSCGVSLWMCSASSRCRSFSCCVALMLSAKADVCGRCRDLL